MGLILTATAGLVLWLVLWAINVSGFDGILIAILMCLVALGRHVPEMQFIVVLFGDEPVVTTTSSADTDISAGVR